MTYESKWSLFSRSVQLSAIRNAKVKLKRSLRSQAVPNTARMKTKKTQTNPQSSDLRLQTTGLKLLVQLQSEFLHPHGDKGRHHKPSDTNVGTQLGLDSSSSGLSLSFQTLILSEVSLFQTQLLCLEVPQSSWTEESAAHLCNKRATAASPDQESWTRGNLEKVKNNYWFLSNPSVPSPFYTNLGGIWTDTGRICTRCTAADAGQR